MTGNCCTPPLPPPSPPPPNYLFMSRLLNTQNHVNCISGQIRSDNRACYHNETEVSNTLCCFTQSRYTYTGQPVLALTVSCQAYGQANPRSISLCHRYDQTGVNGDRFPYLALSAWTPYHHAIRTVPRHQAVNTTGYDKNLHLLTTVRLNQCCAP